MTDKQETESKNQRLLRTGTVALTVLTPVINTLAARLAQRLEQNKKQPGTEKVVIAAKQSLSDALLERGEALVQELEDLVERGTHLSQSLVARSSEVTHELAERGSDVSQDLLKRSEEIRKDLRKRGQRLNKDLSKRSEKVAKDLSKRSEKVTRELSKRSRQATQQLSERSGTFWVISGFAVGLTATAITAYLLIRRRVKQQEQLEVDQSFPLSQNGYLNTHAPSSSGRGSTPTPSGATSKQQIQPSIVEENAPAVAVAEQENKRPAAQSAPTNAAFVGVIGTRRYYPISTPLNQLASPETANNAVIYFTTEEEAKAQGYSPAS